MTGLSGSLLWRIAVNGFLSSPAVPPRLKPKVLRLLGADVADSAKIARRVDITSERLTVGSGAFINAGVMIQNAARVTIGRRVFIGPGALLIAMSHEVGQHAKRAGAPTPAPITIGDGVWIGAGAIVLPGVNVGEGCVIGAGAVVTADCAPDGLYVGVPARRARDLG